MKPITFTALVAFVASCTHTTMPARGEPEKPILAAEPNSVGPAIDVPAQLASTGVYATSGYPSFGTIVGNAGDVNGDGISDIVLGDPGDATDRIPVELWIVSGTDGNVLSRIVLPQERSKTFLVDGGVDIDGDGVPDLLIGAHALRRGEKDEAHLYLASGKTGSILRSIAVNGVARGDFARFISDADHDGIPDVGVLNLPASSGDARLSIYSSRSSKAVAEIPLENESGAINGGFVEVDDIDNDGRKDIVIVLDGAEDHFAILRAYSAAKKQQLWEHRSKHDGGGAPCKLVMLADLDGDGVREFAVSFQDRVEVILGKTGELRYWGEPSGGRRASQPKGYGFALAGLGKAGGNGFTDFVVSQTEGAINGILHAYSGTTGKDLWEIDFEDDVQLYTLGYTMAALGDVDGDGISDLIVGSWGQARVISGKDGSLMSQFKRKGDDVVETKRSVLPIESR